MGIRGVTVKDLVGLEGISAGTASLSVKQSVHYRDSHIPGVFSCLSVGVVDNSTIVPSGFICGATDVLMEAFMGLDPYLVVPNETVDSLLRNMQKFSLNCAIVSDDDGVIVALAVTGPAVNTLKLMLSSLATGKGLELAWHISDN